MSLTGVCGTGAACPGDLEDDEAVWLIISAAAGVPREIAEASLCAGRRVVATAPQRDELWALAARHGGAVPIALDLDDELADREAVEEIVRRFGRLDVVVVHAGAATASANSAGEALAGIQSGLFSALWITEAALAHMRRAGHGHFVLVVGPGVSALAPRALETASRAIDGFSERLALDAARFGVGVTMCVPPDQYQRWRLWAAPRTYRVARSAPIWTS